MDFKEATSKIELILKVSKFATIATANKDGDVSASQVCIVSDKLNVYFQTDKTFEKIQNIKQNPKVAINIGAYCFKGVAEIVGHPTKNEKFIVLLQSKHPETYEHYTKLPNEVLVKIKLTEAKIWGIDTEKDVHKQETITAVNFKTKKVKEIKCDKM